MSDKSLEQILLLLDEWGKIKTDIENEEQKLWNEIKEGVNFFGKMSKSGKSKKNMKIPEFSFMPKTCTKEDNSLISTQKTSMPTNPKRKAKEENLQQQTYTVDYKNALKKWDVDEPMSSTQYFGLDILGSNFKISKNKNEESAKCKKEDYNIEEDETIKASDSLTVTSFKRTSQSLTSINEVPNKKSKKDLSLSSDQMNIIGQNIEDPLKSLQPQEQNVPSSSYIDIRRSQRTMAQKKERSVLATPINPTKQKIKKINQLQPSIKPGISTGIKKKLTPVNHKDPISAIPVKSGIKKPRLLQKNKEQASKFKQRQKMEENLRKQELASKSEEKKLENVDVDNYGILDFEEGDITTEKIPTWAKRENLLSDIKYQQAISQGELTQYFAMPSKTPNLRNMFGKHTTERVRTSSAVWPSPG
ncbi:uncharacterized protein LOC106661255 isoform X2 [Cimex lectularius]|uniref:Inner centromere protein ARK-binding domain-containing protein n=1 Tax=Cimex lectularius TaxID=79782 RepID=A0A8I6RA59_CIMLE|nr:uncharacterized protein LOC106661255 isoform X2 [Cimex lectularius]